MTAVELRDQLDAISLESKRITEQTIDKYGLEWLNDYLA